MTKTPFAKWLSGAAVAAMTLSTFAASSASAQPYDQNQPPPGYGQGGAYAQQPYSDPCADQKRDHEVAGGVIGGIAGAVIGSNLARGGGRSGGAVIGGLAGAAVGAGVGANASNGCQAQDAPPPPPPPAPPAYYPAPPPPAPAYYPPPPPTDDCGVAEVRVVYPDGTEERHPQRACRDAYGHYHLVRRAN